jgi:NADH-quinone oxidoreductase subunit L
MSVGLMDKVYLLPLIMACSFVVILFFGKRLPEKATAAIGITAVSVCFVLAFFVGVQWIQRVNNPPTGAAEDAAKVQCEGGPADSPQAIPPLPGATNAATSSEQAANVSAAEEGAAGTTPSSESTGGESEQQVIPVCASVTWFETAVTDHTIKFEAGTILDGLSAMMLFVVTLISMLVHWYSVEYLHDDRRFTHYYAFLSLFTAAMLFYVMSSNTLQMLVGWELVGLCSFALIGHWWEERANTDAALKAFLTNRVGDTGLIIGVIITFFAAGATSFNVLHINNYALASGANTTLLLLGALALFWGVTSKSGQFPLHTWLPDAMAGPTPVSALIHAATMVVAGVYLVARLYSVYWTGLDIAGRSINYVALIGGLTTLVGASLAFVQFDVKKVLAYSTISQLGYMVMALGVGAWTGGVFHLFTHAFFKACLFLCAGSMSHACHHTFDMREMGGLKKTMPITRWCFIFSGLALAGIFPLAGFWSKDEIIAGAGYHAYYLMLAMGLITAFLTAAYMCRAYRMAFHGEYRGHAHPHESPKIMTVPLMILAGCSLVVGLLNFPKIIGIITTPDSFAQRFEHYVQPTYAFPIAAEQGPPFNGYLGMLSVALAVIAIILAWAYYAAENNPLRGLTDRLTLARWGYTALEKKYGLDWLYERGIRDDAVMPAASFSYFVNQKIIDGVVNAVGVGARFFGGILYKYVDQGAIDGTVNGTGLASEEGGQLLRRIQTGKVQQYAALFFVGASVFVLAFIIALR